MLATAHLPATVQHGVNGVGDVNLARHWLSRGDILHRQRSGQQNKANGGSNQRINIFSVIPKRLSPGEESYHYKEILQAIAGARQRFIKRLA